MQILRSLTVYNDHVFRILQNLRAELMRKLLECDQLEKVLNDRYITESMSCCPMELKLLIDQIRRCGGELLSDLNGLESRLPRSKETVESYREIAESVQKLVRDNGNLHPPPWTDLKAELQKQKVHCKLKYYSYSWWNGFVCVHIASVFKMCILAIDCIDLSACLIVAFKDELCDRLVHF